MNIYNTFSVDDIELILNTEEDTEKILYNGQVLSTLSTGAGIAHEFKIGNDIYLINTSTGFLYPVHIDAIKNGKKAKVKRNRKDKIKGSVQIACGWPLVLVLIGGALGGGLGGAAYVINIKLYRSKLPLPIKIILNILSGLFAFSIWAAISGTIRR